MRLIDIGANLAHDSFDDDRDEVLQRARDVGVEKIVLTGSSDDSNRDAARLAESAPGFLYATAGMHPHHASDYTDESDALIRDLVLSNRVVAVGECGLDYFRNFSPRAAQIDAFERQLEIARESGMPLFLHQRDAHDDFLAIMEPRLDKLGPAVAHCFTGNESELKAYIELDLYIGITGWVCDERRGTDLQRIVGLIPDDRLMIETDAPYLLPRTIRPRPKSRRNEPMYLPEVLRMVADCRGQSYEHVAEITRENAERFFGL
ncbi:MAG: TatD family hydrolase [Woeseiaceae bacterium]|nr:TatD family hydrolase [Woeseiaceae bacterium]